MTPANFNLDDPYGSFASYRVDALKASGSPIGTGALAFSPASHTTEVGAGADGYLNASRLLDFQGDGQRLTLGAFFDFRTFQTDFDATTVLSGAQVRHDTYAAGGTFGYYNGDFYARGRLGGLLGHGELSSPQGNGGFSDAGYTGDILAGKLFTLLDARVFPGPSATTKGPPPAIGGYRVGLDLAGRVWSSQEELGGFTDTQGFTRGAERLTVWAIGGRARLFTDIFCDSYIWTPYISGFVDQEAGYSHTLFIPLQTGAPAGGTVNFGAPGRTFGGAQAGLSVLGPNGVSVGLDGSYAGSSGANVVRGRAYIRIPILW